MWYPSNKQVVEIERALSDLARSVPSDPGQVSDLLVKFSHNLGILTRSYEFPVSLVRDWIWIASRYRIDSSPLGEAGSTAGVSLLWLESQLHDAPNDHDSLLRAFRWVTANTVATLRAFLGPELSSEFLTKEEISEIEDELDKLRDHSGALTEQDRETIREYISIFEDVESETYLPGIGTMISAIVQHANGADANAAEARAALHYLIKKTDIVPDNLGYAGLVDDIYILEKVFREQSGRSTWDALLPNFHKRWPFLEDLQFGPLGQSRRLSNFTQVAAGLFLHSLEETSERPILVLPQTGPTGFILCLLMAIQNLRHQDSREDVLQTLAPGDHIFLRNSSVELRTIYSSDLEYGDQKFTRIELRKNLVNTISPEFLASAIKAPEPHRRLSTNEEFEEWRSNYSPDPLTHLLGRSPSPLTNGPAVIFLTRKNRLDRFMEEILPMGGSLGELVGVHYVTATGKDIDTPAASGVGPMVWACSDTLIARELLDSIPAGDVRIPVLVDDADLAAELADTLSAADQDANILCVVAAQFEGDAIRRLSTGKNRTWWLERKDVDLVREHKTGLVSKSSDSLTRFDACQSLSASARIDIHEVECPELQNLAKQLDDLRPYLKETLDPALQLAVMSASGLLRRYGRQPLWNEPVVDAELGRMLLNLDHAASALSGFVEQVDPLRSLVSEMRIQGLPDNPKPERVRNIINEYGLDEFCILAPSETLAAQATGAIDPSDVLAKAQWLSINSLRSTAPVHNLIVTGWLDRKIMREIRVAGFAENVFYVLLPFEKEWELKSSQATERNARYLAAASEKSWSKLSDELNDEIPKPSALDATDIPTVIELEDKSEAEAEKDYLEERLVDYIRSRQQHQFEEKQAVQGRLVTFEEAGLYTYLPPHGTVINISRALRLSAQGAAEAEPAADALVVCPVNDVERGDLLAFAEGGGSDLLDVLADRFIKESQATRDTANLWRTAIRMYLKNHRLSIGELHQRLGAAGLQRHKMTVTYWINNENIIAPHSWQTAIPTIAEVTGDKELTEKLDECGKAIDLIYRARRQASQAIVDQIMQGEMDLDQGFVHVLIDGHEARYRLLRVQTIQPPEMVSADSVHVIGSLANDLDHRAAST